jgi:hypothetical protein
MKVEKEWLQLQQNASERLPVHIFRLGGALLVLLVQLLYKRLRSPVLRGIPKKGFLVDSGTMGAYRHIWTRPKCLRCCEEDGPHGTFYNAIALVDLKSCYIADEIS